MFGLFGLSLHAANIPFWKNQNFDFFLGKYKKNKKTSKISISIKNNAIQKLFIGLSAFKKKYQILNSIKFICFCFAFLCQIGQKAKKTKYL